MINWDAIIDSAKVEYKNKMPLIPQHPSRCLVIGPSGSGKTSDLLTILHHSCFHKVYIYSKTLDEEKYEFLIAMQKQKEIALKRKGIAESLVHFSTEIRDAIQLENLDKGFQHAYVFDDICLENKKEQEKYIGAMWIRCRKYNASAFYLSQSFFKIPKVIRDNANFIVLKKLADLRELDIIHKIYAAETNRCDFRKKYLEAVTSLGGHGSFVIDNQIRHQSLKLRANYTSLFD